MQLLQLSLALRLQQPQLLVGAAGDVLVYEAMHKEAMAARSYRPLWQAVSPAMQAADVFFATLEGTATASFDASQDRLEAPNLTFSYGDTYQSWRNAGHGGQRSGKINGYNYHPQIASDLVSSGVDVVSLSNNHAIDRGPAGLADTAATLAAAGLPALVHDVVTVARGGWATAWVGCTDFVNIDGGCSTEAVRAGNCTAQKAGADLYGCEEETYYKAVAAAASTRDAVICSMHMDGGNQYEATDLALDRVNLTHRARRCLEAGAALALVSGSHVVRSGWEVVVTADGRQTVAVYSLGNLLSNVALELRKGPPFRSAVLERLAQDGDADQLQASMLWFSGLVNPRRAEVSCVSFVPICWAPDTDYGPSGISTSASFNCTPAAVDHLQSILPGAHATSGQQAASGKPGCTPIGKFK